ncbi:hypothetical protein PG985_012649 [Apiospora marii]|uniref:uncharacterized protein n=1 Tax=Apiospora marii TaxID=335849 RepID=UPI003132187B
MAKAIEQHRLFREFQEYLLKLMEQDMGVGSTLIPMKAVVMTACPGHFVTTSVDSSGKREDVLVGWLDDQKGRKDDEDQEDSCQQTNGKKISNRPSTHATRSV